MRPNREALTLTLAMFMLPLSGKAETKQVIAPPVACTREAIASLMAAKMPLIVDDFGREGRETLDRLFLTDPKGKFIVDDAKLKRTKDILRGILHIGNTELTFHVGNKEGSAIYTNFDKHEFLRGNLIICGVSYRFEYDIDTHEVSIAGENVDREEVVPQTKRDIKKIGEVPRLTCWMYFGNFRIYFVRIFRKYHLRFSGGDIFFTRYIC